MSYQIEFDNEPPVDVSFEQLTHLNDCGMIELYPFVAKPVALALVTRERLLAAIGRK